MRQHTGRTGIIATEVVGVHLTVTAAARLFGLSRQHVYRLLKRFREAARRPSTHAHATPPSNPHTITDEVTVAIVGLRERLTADGLDAGPRTLQWHLAQQGLPAPFTSTIRRILGHHGLITPQPRKRPRSSYIRFQAAQHSRMLTTRLHPRSAQDSG